MVKGSRAPGPTRRTASVMEPQTRSLACSIFLETLVLSSNLLVCISKRRSKCLMKIVFNIFFLVLSPLKSACRTTQDCNLCAKRIPPWTISLCLLPKLAVMELVEKS